VGFLLIDQKGAGSGNGCMLNQSGGAFMADEWNNNKLFKFISLDFLVLLIVAGFGGGVAYQSLGSEIENNAAADIRLQTTVNENKQIASRTAVELQEVKIEIATIKLEQRLSQEKLKTLIDGQVSQSDKLDRLVERVLDGR
jgi:hypothetical protein